MFSFEINMPIVRSNGKAATSAFMKVCLIHLQLVAGGFPAPPGLQAHAAAPSRAGERACADLLLNMAGIKREGAEGRGDKRGDRSQQMIS
jgi:hypothetical protein